MVLAPLLLLAGVLLRVQVPFFFPHQIAAVTEQPRLMLISYSLVLAAHLTMWPGVVMLAQSIGQQRPGLATWGGALVIFGTGARIFHAGVDHLAFQLVHGLGPAAATTAIADSYGAFHVAAALSPVIMAGWIVLAVGAYRAAVLGPSRAVALALMSALMIGVLKGTHWTSVLAAAGLCIAFVPTGLGTMRREASGSLGLVLAQMALTAAAIAALLHIGRLG